VPIDGLTAYAHVADVQRSIDFYRRLGLEPRNRHESGGKLVWAFVVAAAADNPAGAGARLMLARARGGLDPSAQGVLFYCWTPDVRRLHDELVAAGVEAGEVEHPFYMPSGEFRVVDPDATSCSSDNRTPRARPRSRLSSAPEPKTPSWACSGKSHERERRGRLPRSPLLYSCTVAGVVAGNGRKLPGHYGSAVTTSSRPR
jgi:catechol 2,3-dioxygenase-like lactoylglutathione lyase family enzyme